MAKRKKPKSKFKGIKNRNQLLKRVMKTTLVGSSAQFVINWNHANHEFGDVFDGVNITHKNALKLSKARIAWQEIGDYVANAISCLWLVEVAINCQESANNFYFEQAQIEIRMKFDDLKTHIRTVVLPDLYREINPKHYTGRVTYRLTVLDY